MARKTGSVNHIHQYYRRPDGLWACSGIDGCTHYMPRNMAPAPVGLYSKCWGNCEKAFQLTPYAMENNKPMCDDCQEGLDAINEITEKFLKKAVKPTGLAAFGARTVATKEPKSKTMADVEEDEIEVIDEYEQHTPSCDIRFGGDCSCKGE